jgi:hypothetical protein
MSLIEAQIPFDYTTCFNGFEMKLTKLEVRWFRFSAIMRL